jgi:hypothetical protein
MKKSDLIKNHDKLDGALKRYRLFMEKILAAQRVVGQAQEKRDIAESVLLRICANWERFVDEQLVDCVNRDHSKLSEYFSVSIPKNPSVQLCHALLIGARYTDFKSFDDLKGFSKKVLPDSSNPFLAVQKSHSTKVNEIFIMRNYLSHYSARAKNSLFGMYKLRYGLTRFREPGYFLLADQARRLWAYFDAVGGASADMKLTY